jgi:hypothetical protein
LKLGYWIPIPVPYAGACENSKFNSRSQLPFVSTGNSNEDTKEAKNIYVMNGFVYIFLFLDRIYRIDGPG